MEFKLSTVVAVYDCHTLLPSSKFKTTPPDEDAEIERYPAVPVGLGQSVCAYIDISPVAVGMGISCPSVPIWVGHPVTVRCGAAAACSGSRELGSGTSGTWSV